MTLNRRNLLKISSGSLLTIPLAGCLSSPSEKLGDMQVSKSEDSFTLSQQTEGDLKNIQLKLTYESMTSDDVGTLKTFTESDLKNKYNKYTKQISKENVFTELPEGKPVKVYLESSLKGSEFTKSKLIGSRYYMVRYVTGGTEHHVDTDMVKESVEGDSISVNKLHKWESEQKIHFKIFYNMPYNALKSVENSLPMEDREYVQFIPFVFDLSISKDKKDTFDELRENRKITWQQFHKEVKTESGTIKYYEQDMVKDFANQIKSQLTHYDRDFSGIKDVTLLLRIWDDLIEYDYASLESDELNLKYFSQILYDGDSICQGTTFSIASILHQLGYDVGMQAIVEKHKWDYPNAFHMEATAELNHEYLEEARTISDKYTGPDTVLDDIPEDEVENHHIVYPGKPIGENPSERWDTKQTEFVEVERVQMEFLESNS